jgi:group II intron reverse transcriptase/maturase
VKSNKGSSTAGVNGQTIEDFSEDLGENLGDLAEDLKSRSFDPKPVRRTYIPKGDGEERPLGIPTIKDRIVQEALRMLLEPIYESYFSDRSYGFRPNRSTLDAIKAVKMSIAVSTKSRWVIDADIKGFFDNVDHRKLDQIIQKRIRDQKVRDLIWKFLKAGIMEEGKYRNSRLGTPQGGIVSPVLANIYLNELDQWAKKWTDFNAYERIKRREKGKGNWDFVRYADDFLFLTNGSRGKADEMRGRIGNFVREELNLKLSEKKTEIVHASDGLEFLGYHLRLTDEGGVFKSVPEEAKDSLLGKIKRMTSGGTEISSRRKIKSLNALLRGWANYYKYANDAGAVFNKLDHRTWENLTDWLARKHKCSKRKLYSNKLEGKSPLKINGVKLYKMGGDGELYTDEYSDKDHPYLNDKARTREQVPESNAYLGEDRKGWFDARWKSLQRDNWKCQMCGRDLRGLTPHVHHKRPYSSQGSKEEANRLDNLESLCPDCHNSIESDRNSH